MSVKKLLLASLAVAGIAQADLVLVDFGGLAPANPIGGLHFNQWNPGDNLDLLLASDGSTDSGWNMDSSTAAVVNNGTSPDYTPSFNGAPSPFSDDTVTSDALNLGSGDGTRNIRFLNLNPSTAYNLVIYGGRDSTETRITAYSVIGGSTVNGTLETSGTSSGTGSNYNNDDTFTVSNILPDVSGRITIEYSVDTGSFGYINAVSLSTVPEPGTLTLLGLAGAGIYLIRRRR